MYANFDTRSVLEPFMLFTGRINVEHPMPFIPNIGLMYAPISLQGYAVIHAEVSLFAQNRRSNFTQSHELYFYNTVHMFDISLYYGTPFIEKATKGWLNVDLGMNLKLLSIPNAFKPIDSALPINILPVPSLYVAFQIAPATYKFAIEGELRMLPSFVISALTDEFGAYAYDGIFRFKYKIYDPAFISLGYRYQDIGGGTNGVYMALIAHGTFLEAGAAF